MNKMNSLISGIAVFIFELSLYNSVSNIVTIQKKKKKIVERKAWQVLGDLVQSLLSQGTVCCAPHT